MKMKIRCIDGERYRNAFLAGADAPGTAEELADDEQVRKLYLGRNFELKRKDWLHEEAINSIEKQKEK